MARSPETADLAAQLDALRADVRALAETLAQMGDSTSQSLRATLEQSFADLKAKGSATVAGCTLEMAESLTKLAPFGNGNEEPTLVLPRCRILRAYVGRGLLEGLEAQEMLGCKHSGFSVDVTSRMIA